MGSSVDYSPPNSSAIARAQNAPDPLRLLLAQRRMYSKAKFWLAIQWIGMLVISIIAPVTSVLNTHLAVVAGAVAGIWIFVGRTLLARLQRYHTNRAAIIQEQFDFEIFGMPRSIERTSGASLEDVAALTGSDAEVARDVVAEELIDWYPINSSQNGALTIAICQRANASYSDRLLRTTAAVWALAIALWIIALIIWSLARDLDLDTFLLGIAFPLLPAFLDVVKYSKGIYQASQDRAELANSIQSRIEQRDIEPTDLLVWQERLYELRRTTPEVPDRVYKIMRPINEAAMHAVAAKLGGNGSDKSE